MMLDTAAAQALFDALPNALRWPTLSPAYVQADAARDPLMEPVFLAYREGEGVLMHSLMESAIPGAAGCDWQSAYGYGGPLAHGLDEDALTRAWQHFDEVARARRVIAEFVRFHPGLRNQQLYSGRVVEDRAVVTVDLDVPDLLASYSGRARTAIRKALRGGLSAAWLTRDDAIAQFPAFYRRCMEEIGATAFYFFPDEYFVRLLGLSSARVVAIQRGEKTLSMGAFLMGPEQAEYHLSGTAADARPSGATNLLLHAAADAAKEAGCRRLYLGGGTSSRPDDPLLNFKRSFAESEASFYFGGRVHDIQAYDALRARHRERAESGRILFYRS
jgi:hypothetical protein